MKTYVYKDNSVGKWEKINGEIQWVAPVVFTCEAETISDADEKFKKAIGKDVVRMTHITCGFKSLGLPDSMMSLLTPDGRQP